MMLRFIYTLFVGVLLAAFVGVGIAAFYSAPQPPTMPASLKVVQPSNVDQKVFQQLPQDQEKFDTLQLQYEQAMNRYNRNVSIIAIVASIIMVTLSLSFFHQILIIADGLLLGGVLTLLYGIGRGFGSGDDRFRFIVVSVGLLVALVLGYIKFIQPRTSAGEESAAL